MCPFPHIHIYIYIYIYIYVSCTYNNISHVYVIKHVNYDTELQSQVPCYYSMSTLYIVHSRERE